MASEPRGYRDRFMNDPSTSSEPPSSTRSLRRQVGVPGAVSLGLGSMVGTGVFVAIGLGAAAAGWGVVPAVVLAGGLAWCNALSSAQLAAAHPVAGGTYEYGHRFLTPALGAVAGWMFLVAKSASAATAALGLAGYGLGLLGFGESDSVRVAVALLVLVGVMVIVLEGLKRSTAVNTAIVAVTLIALTVFVVSVFVVMPEQPSLISGGPPKLVIASADFDEHVMEWADISQLLTATALMFVAYTGYGRIATLAEEVREPARTIPRAVAATMTVTLLLYLAVSLAALVAVGPERLAELTTQTAAPLESIARDVGLSAAVVWMVALGAVTAMLGVLLNLVLGLSRVALAMGRRGHLFRVFERVDDTGTTPAPAVLLVAAIIGGLVLVGSIQHAWSLSAVTVLVYYGLTNAAALRLPPEARRYPRVLAWAGLLGCLGLSVMLPWVYVAVGFGLVGGSLLAHAVTEKARGAKNNRAG